MAERNTNITYLFGAGASIGNTKQWIDKLPVRPDRVFTKQFENLSNGIPITDYLDQYRFYLELMISDHNNLLTSKVKKSFEVENALGILMEKKLRRAFKSQLSPDTYGKMLKISKREEQYESFKWELSTFINLFDSLTYPDVRYPNLLANFLDFETGKVPPNINFLTYNFDAAPEKSYFTFEAPESVKNASIEDLREKYGIVCHSEILQKINKEESVWIKIHGSAGEVIKDGKLTTLFKIGEPDFEDYDHIGLPNPHYYTEIASENNLEIKRYHSFDCCANIFNKGNQNALAYGESNLRFAWDVPDDDPVFNFALSKLELTEILVVVGYTFPAFNQKNDFKLLNFLDQRRFERIVVQLPGEEGQEVKRKILQMYKNLGSPKNEDFIEVIPDCSSFHIPVEYFSNYEPPLIHGFS